MAGQPDETPKGAGVKALSSRLLQMKFMKRGQAAEATTKAASSRADLQASQDNSACLHKEQWSPCCTTPLAFGMVCRIHPLKHLRTRGGLLGRHKAAVLSYQSQILLLEPYLGT